MNIVTRAKIRTYGLIFVGLCVVAGLLIIFRTYVMQQRNENVLVVGMLPADAPFYSINEKGEPEGFDVDVARAVAQGLGKQLVFKELGVPELFLALQAGKIDMFLCGLSITKKRLEHIAMVHYQGSGVTTFPLVFWKNIPHAITSLNDLRGKNCTIAVLPATLQEDFARQHDCITIKPVGSYAHIIMELQYGKVNAALFDEAISGFIKQFPELQVIDVPIGDFESRGHGIAIAKENEQLRAQTEHIVEQLKREGTIARFEETWDMGGSV